MDLDPHLCLYKLPVRQTMTDDQESTPTGSGNAEQPHGSQLTGGSIMKGTGAPKNSPSFKLKLCLSEFLLKRSKTLKQRFVPIHWNA